MHREKSTRSNRVECLFRQKEIKRYNQRMKLLELQISEIEGEMEEKTANDPFLSRKLSYITSIAETSGFALIKSGKQLTSYAG